MRMDTPPSLPAAVIVAVDGVSLPNPPFPSGSPGSLNQEKNVGRTAHTCKGALAEAPRPAPLIDT